MEGGGGWRWMRLKWRAGGEEELDERTGVKVWREEGRRKVVGGRGRWKMECGKITGRLEETASGGE